MVTPHVTEILPPWRAARELPSARRRAHSAQRDLVIASLFGEGARRDVYPVRPLSVVEPRL
jgi:hypothetical protein